MIISPATLAALVGHLRGGAIFSVGKGRIRVSDGVSNHRIKTANLKRGYQGKICTLTFGITHPSQTEKMTHAPKFNKIPARII